MPQCWPCKPREILLMVLALLIILVYWNTEEKLPMDNMWSKTRYSYQTVGVDSDTDNYTQQIATYLEGRQKGLSQEQIANDIFKVSIGGPITLALG